MSSVPKFRTANSKTMIVTIAAQRSALSKVSQVDVDGGLAFFLVITVSPVSRRLSASVKSVEQQYVTKRASIISRVNNTYLIPYSPDPVSQAGSDFLSASELAR
jgi:hypothetical protein